MIGIVYSRLDPAGSNMAGRILKNWDFKQTDGRRYLKYEGNGIRVYEVDVPAYAAEFADSFICDALVFLSRHKSEAEVDAFTTHSLGNWRPSADFGGKPKLLSFAAPTLMLSVLRNISKIEEPIEKTYEATHHGPLLNTPSLFVEIGGSEKMVGNKPMAEKLADAALASVANAMNNAVEYEKVAIGIGSNHYPEKFSRLALDKGYAFSHILPKYAILNDDGSNNLDVLAQALERSSEKPEIAVVDWKSLNSVMKEQTIKKLNEIGLDNEKI